MMRFPLVRLWVLLFASVVCLFTAAPARASLLITGDTTATVQAGGTTFVNFTITSSGDQLGAFNLELRIAPISAVSQLQFSSPVDTQPLVYNQSHYVFAGTSGDAPGPFWRSLDSFATANDTIIGGDFTTASSGGVTITPSNNLLATVQVAAPLGASPGETFSISVIPDQTSFVDALGNVIAYDSTPAIVTVMTSPAISVPEPSSLVLAGACGLTGLLCYRRNRRKV
jgi:hypothetical protein